MLKSSYYGQMKQKLWLVLKFKNLTHIVTKTSLSLTGYRQSRIRLIFCWKRESTFNVALFETQKKFATVLVYLKVCCGFLKDFFLSITVI